MAKEKNIIHVHIPYPLLLKRFDYILDEGINPEVYIDGEYLDNAEPQVLKEIERRLTGRGRSLTVHGPYADINPGAVEEDKRLATVERYRQVFEVSRILRPKNIVLHAGYSDRAFKGDAELWLAQSMKTWPQFVKEAASINAVIAAENIFEKAPWTLKMLAKRIDSPNFRLCIDSGHLNVFSNVPMEEWFRELGPFIAEAHLHDNNGRNDDHMPLGKGSIDFPSFFRYLEVYASGPVYTIEPHGEEALKEGLEAIRRFL